jgi:hypothetical protein
MFPASLFPKLNFHLQIIIKDELRTRHLWSFLPKITRPIGATFARREGTKASTTPSRNMELISSSDLRIVN